MTVEPGLVNTAGIQNDNPMNIEKIIKDLPNADRKKIHELQANANRILNKDSTHLQAKRLLSAISSELDRRKISTRFKVGSLWWEPHDPAVGEFFAYAEQHSTIRVAAITKNATHTATRKRVYSVKIGDQNLDGEFAEVAIARQAGSDAWEQAKKVSIVERNDEE
jgi:hypothetical protein